MAEGEKEEEKFDFTTEGEVQAFLTLDQARFVAVQTAREEPGNYGSMWRSVPMAFEVGDAVETEDDYALTLTFRPEGEFTGTPGREQFVFRNKIGEVAFRQVLSLPMAEEQRRYPVLSIAIAAVLIVLAGAIAGFLFLGSVPLPESPPTSTPSPPRAATPSAPTVSVSVVPGAPAELVSPKGDVTVNVPEGSVDAPVTLNYRFVPADQAPDPPEGIASSAVVFDLSIAGPSSGTFNFKVPATITVIFSTSDVVLAGGLESNVVIRQFNNDSRAWLALPTSVDFQARSAQVSVDHLSLFSLNILNPDPFPKPTLTPMFPGPAIFAWGLNNEGQLGDGTTTDRRAPVQVASLGVVDVAAGAAYSLAVKSDGRVWAWGQNVSGQLGDGTTAHRITPVQVARLAGVVDVGAGTGHSLALKTDGTVWAWGANSVGQLGDGTKFNRPTLVQVAGLSEVAAIDAGGFHNLAVKTDGTVWAWGGNNEGQLGDGTTTDRTSPVQVATGVVGLGAGFTHSVAVLSDGTVWAWGENDVGQLGDGTTINRTIPVEVAGLTGIVAVAGGERYSLALKTDGTVWAWGQNGSGQVGDGTTTDRTSPVQVAGITGVVAIATGGFHSLALKSDGTVWGWGQNWAGQLGYNDPTNSSRTTPVQVTEITGITAIAAGMSHSLASK